jgi:hypothetical protein
MGLFFLLAGLLTPGSLDLKGSRRFAGDRLLRLGVPWAASALAATLSFPLLVLVADAVGLPADLAAERQPPERPWPSSWSSSPSNRTRQRRARLRPVDHGASHPRRQ